MTERQKRLVEIAREEAGKNYHGNTASSVSNLHPLAESLERKGDLPDDDWSGAFAYRCAILAGYSLPPRYPDPRVRDGFHTPAAWYDYARLPKIGIWQTDPVELEPGDFVILRTSEGRPDLMGIVLEADLQTIVLAAGNYRNHSAVIDFPTGEIFGFFHLRE